MLASFWGKTGDAAKSGGPAYKPVLHHLLDVAASALRLQLGSPSRLAREAAVLATDPEHLAKVSAFLAGLHDIGKFSRAFQAKVPELWPQHLGTYPGAIEVLSHWRNSAIMFQSAELRPLLKPILPNLDGDSRPVIWAAIAGHHGRPPSATEYKCDSWFASKGPGRNQIGAEALDAAAEAIAILHDLVRPEPVESLETMEQAKAWSWRLAGLTNLADWVGSDQRYFCFREIETPLADYWDWALRQADAAIGAKGLAPAAARRGIGFTTIAPDIARPTPMQAAADRLALPEGPMLVVIEDTTGSGKTEAALTLAGRMIEAGKGEGLYFALPTMATANAMYGRLQQAHQRLFAEGTTPSLVLAHGRALLAQPFAGSIGRRPAQPGEEAAAWCSEWIADNRRKAFFADLGAGTIDQAFLSALKKRFLTLRQYGLAGRILLVDEAHSFDAYMSRELQTLLQMHANLGGSAIVLSATLPRQMRQELAQAFRAGLGQAGTAAPGSDHYPLLTSVSRVGVEEHATGFDQRLRRTVAIERLPDRDAAHAAALEAAAQGAAVLVIRNAVDEAAGSHDALRAAGAEAQFFHARFAMCDRQRIETDVLGRFGKNSTKEDRAGRILVATQVVEQSLDLDFDLIVSDLAPIDLVIQRAGRLWRHMDRRPADSRAVPGPRILLISPHPDEATTEKWLEPAIGVGAAVYDHPGVMWRTAKVLFEAGRIRTPEDLRDSIERVYEADDAPECLQNKQGRAVGDEIGRGNIAQGNLIRPESEGYHQIGELAADQEIGTRWGEETVTLRLARRHAGRLIPWAKPVDTAQPQIEYAQNWALSEISVRRTWLGPVTQSAQLIGEIERVRAAWPEWERDAISVAVVEDDGRVLLEGANALSYSADGGLKKVKR